MTAGPRSRCLLVLISDERPRKLPAWQRWGVWQVTPGRARGYWEGPTMQHGDPCGGGRRIIRKTEAES